MKIRKLKKKYRSPQAVEAALTRFYNKFFKEHVLDESPPKTLYHYCLADAMRKILFESHSLWASDIFCMNDKTEVTYSHSEILGLDQQLVKDTYGKLRMHIACFSSEELPGQWKRYADDCKGCAIGFDQAALQKYVFSREGLLSLFPVNYSRDGHEMMKKRFCEGANKIFESASFKGTVSDDVKKALHDEASKYLFCLAETMKHQDWQDEREWRILVTPARDGGRKHEHAFEPVDRFGVCRFFLPIGTAEFVTEIVLGPKCSINGEELKAELTNSGLGSISVRQSLCPCPDDRLTS